MKKIKVFLCDDHRLFREGIRKLLELEKDICVVGEASEAKDAINKVRRTAPDVMLMDIGLPGMDGVEVARRIKNENPKVNIIILTVHQIEKNIFDAIKAGASGYLLKKASGKDLIDAIRRVNRGEALIEPKIMMKVIEEFNLISRGKKPADEEIYSELTTRENDVLRWVALGASNKEIAGKLAISEKTAKNHLSNIFHKLHVSSRTQAAVYVFREKKLQT